MLVPTATITQPEAGRSHFSLVQTATVDVQQWANWLA